MPSNIVKTPHEEKMWEQAKDAVRKEYGLSEKDGARFYSLVTGIYERMKNHIGGKKVRKSMVKGIRAYVASHGLRKSKSKDTEGERWITIHPHGKDYVNPETNEKDYRRILIDDNGHIVGGDVPKDWHGNHVTRIKDAAKQTRQKKQNKPIHEMSNQEMERHILDTENKFEPTTFEIDWGPRPRGQGKRVGKMVTGAMSDVTIQGKKKYKNPFGNLPDYDDKQVKEDTDLLDRHETERYLRARSAGLDHENAMRFAWAIKEPKAYDAIRDDLKNKEQGKNAEPKNEDESKLPVNKPKEDAKQSERPKRPKERHEMTSKEYEQDLRSRGYTDEGVRLARNARWHEKLLVDAILAGKHVPDHVRAEYPDLDRRVQEAREGIERGRKMEQERKRREEEAKQREIDAKEQEKKRLQEHSDRMVERAEAGRQRMLENGWKKTKKEFVGKKRGFDKQLYEADHRESVEYALKHGYPVSDEVLKDYPDLAEQYKGKAKPQVEEKPKKEKKPSRPKVSKEQKAIEAYSELAEKLHRQGHLSDRDKALIDDDLRHARNKFESASNQDADLKERLRNDAQKHLDEVKELLDTGNKHNAKAEKEIKALVRLLDEYKKSGDSSMDEYQHKAESAIKHVQDMINSHEKVNKYELIDAIEKIERYTKLFRNSRKYYKKSKSGIRAFLQKSTTDAEQRREDKRGIRELRDVERVLEEGAEHEEAEMKAEKSKDGKSKYLNPDGTFKGGFDGAVKYFMSQGYSKESAEKIAGKIAAEKHMAGGHRKSRRGIREFAKAKKAHRFAYKTDERDPIFIPVNRIRTPYQTDAALNPDKVRENVRKIKRGEPMPPLIIGYDYDLHDGHHRLEAAKRCGHTHVPCVVGGTNERRVKAAEARYRAVWKSKRKKIGG